MAAATPHDVELVMVRGHIRKSRALTHPDAAYLRKQAEEVRNRITASVSVYRIKTRRVYPSRAIAALPRHDE